MSPAILSRPAVSDAEFPAFWAARHGKPDSDHQPRPGPIGDCLHCRMTHEEMLDFSLIRCEDAREARLPIVVMESGAHQRGLMLEGLAVQAKRRARRFNNIHSVEPAPLPADNRFFYADWPPPGWPKETPVSSVAVGSTQQKAPAENIEALRREMFTPWFGKEADRAAMAKKYLPDPPPDWTFGGSRLA